MGGARPALLTRRRQASLPSWGWLPAGRFSLCLRVLVAGTGSSGAGPATVSSSFRCTPRQSRPGACRSRRRLARRCRCRTFRSSIWVPTSPRCRRLCFCNQMDERQMAACFPCLIKEGTKSFRLALLLTCAALPPEHCPVSSSHFLFVAAILVSIPRPMALRVPTSRRTGSNVN